MKILSETFTRIDRSEEDAIARHLQGKHSLRIPKTVPEYESHIAAEFGAGFCVACPSRTSAFQMSLIASNVGAGDEVLLPPTAPEMSAMSILAIGAVPVFVDTSKEDIFSLDLADLQQKITAKTKAVISVPMWGYPIDESKLLVKLHQRGLILIEHVAQVYGTPISGHAVFHSNHIRCFGIHEQKYATAIEGGFILCDSRHTHAKLLQIRSTNAHNHGDNGANFKINSFSGALGIIQLARSEDRLKIRQQNAALLKRLIESINWIREVPTAEHGQPNYHVFVAEVNHPRLTGRQVKEFLVGEGIAANNIDYEQLSAYRNKRFAAHEQQFPNAESTIQKIITLPTQEDLNEQDITRIANCLRKIAAL